VEIMLSDVQLDVSWEEFFEAKSEEEMRKHMNNWSEYYDFDAGRLTNFE
jgi:hypothetical protein